MFSDILLLKYKNCRKNLNEDQRRGRPEASNRAELVKKSVHFTTRTLAEALNTSKNTIWRILSRDLDKREIFVRYVPHKLIGDQIAYK